MLFWRQDTDEWRGEGGDCEVVEDEDERWYL